MFFKKKKITHPEKALDHLTYLLVLLFNIRTVWLDGNVIPTKVLANGVEIV